MIDITQATAQVNACPAIEGNIEYIPLIYVGIIWIIKGVRDENTVKYAISRGHG